MHVWLYVYAGFEDADAAAAEEDEPQDNDDVDDIVALLADSVGPPKVKSKTKSTKTGAAGGNSASKPVALFQGQLTCKASNHVTLSCHCSHVLLCLLI